MLPLLTLMDPKVHPRLTAEACPRGGGGVKRRSTQLFFRGAHGTSEAAQQVRSRLWEVRGMAGADMIIGVDLNDNKEEMARKFGMTHFVNPSKVDDVKAAIIELTKTERDQIGGVDYSFDATGNVQVMRDALECSHRGWGVSVVIGVAPAGAEISTRPFQLVTGRTWKGTAFGGAKGRTDVPKIVDWYMDGKINIDDLITHKLALDDINEGFDLMHKGESIRAVVEF